MKNPSSNLYFWRDPDRRHQTNPYLICIQSDSEARAAACKLVVYVVSKFQASWLLPIKHILMPLNFRRLFLWMFLRHGGRKHVQSARRCSIQLPPGEATM